MKQPIFQDEQQQQQQQQKTSRKIPHCKQSLPYLAEKNASAFLGFKVADGKRVQKGRRSMATARE